MKTKILIEIETTKLIPYINDGLNLTKERDIIRN